MKIKVGLAAFITVIWLVGQIAPAIMQYVVDIETVKAANFENCVKNTIKQDICGHIIGVK